MKLYQPLIFLAICFTHLHQSYNSDTVLSWQEIFDGAGFEPEAHFVLNVSRKPTLVFQTVLFKINSSCNANKRKTKAIIEIRRRSLVLQVEVTEVFQDVCR